MPEQPRFWATRRTYAPGVRKHGFTRSGNLPMCTGLDDTVAEGVWEAVMPPAFGEARDFCGRY